MTHRLPLQAAAVILAVLGLGFTAPDAQAKHRNSTCSTTSSYHHGHHGHHGHYGHHSRYSHHSRYGNSSSTRVSYKNDGFSVSLGFSSSDRYHSTPRYHSSSDSRVYHTPTTRHHTHTSRTVYVNSSGYWSQVYVQPVYETRYDHCGNPYRTCVRAGYWKRVWVDGCR